MINIDPNQFAVIMNHLHSGEPIAPWMLKALDGYFEQICDDYEKRLSISAIDFQVLDPVFAKILHDNLNDLYEE